MENLILLILCLLFIFVVITSGIMLRLLLKHHKEFSKKLDKQSNKLFAIDQKMQSAEGFQIATYNNSIRLAKKLNVYYCLNKDDYEKHQQKSIENKNETQQ